MAGSPLGSSSRAGYDGVGLPKRKTGGWSGGSGRGKAAKSDAKSPGEDVMATIGRRSLLGGTAGLAASTMLARPYVARAADKTLTVWWNQGFYPAEDQAFRDMVATWEKQSGYKVSLSMVEGNALDQKVISATATGQVPDLIYSDHGAAQTMPQAAWDGKLVDVSDVVDTQKNEFSETALKSAQYYNNVDKKRSFYGVP